MSLYESKDLAAKRLVRTPLRVTELTKSDERVHILLIPIEADIEAVDVSSITAILWVPPSPAAKLYCAL